MSKIIGVTVGTPMSVPKIKEKLNMTADEVKFSDGMTFQQKYDSGELTGPAGKDGKDGATGPAGKDGSTGPAGADGQPGADAKINGVNTLTLTTDEYLSAEQTGSTLKLGLKSVPTSSQSTIVTLSASRWTEFSNGRYIQSAVVDFMTADAPVVSMDVYMSGSDPDADDTMEAAYLGNVYRMTQGAGAVTFWARSVPEVNIQVCVGVS